MIRPMDAERSSSLNIDVEKVRARLDEEDAARARGVFSTAFRVFAFMLLVVALPTLVPLLITDGWRGLVSFLQWEPWSTFALVIGISTLVSALAVWGRFHAAPRDEASAIAQIDREWTSLTSRGWPLRTVLLGLAMAAAVGIPIGMLIARDVPLDELPSGGRPAVVAAFFGMTCLYMMPMAFLIRWKTMRNLRKLERPSA